MDASCNMDTLDDSSTLPELSFDDLLDPSPIKKNGRPSAVHHHNDDDDDIDDDDDDDSLEMSRDVMYSNKRDDTLNTPGPKRPLQFTVQTSSRSTMPITNSSISTKPTPMRANPMKPGGVVGSMKTAGGATHGNPTPILLNTKNVLPKTATQITNNSSIKITPKVTGGNAAGGGGGSGGGVGTSTAVSVVGKTAVRTSTGQLIYIQKSASSSTSSSSAIKTSQANGSSGMVVAKAQPAKVTTASSTGAVGKKPMTIQVMRTADVSFVSVKSANNAGASGKNTTLTLSPTALAGKKIVTSSGAQVLIKTSGSSGATTNSTVTMSVKPVNSTTTASSDSVKTKTIVVQSSGKQIVVSNPSLVKLSPKTQTTAAHLSVATSSSSSSSASQQQGQLQTAHIPGKGRVQYVRVFPSTKVNAKPLTATTSTATTAAVTRTVTVTSASSSAAATGSGTAGQAPVKILNNLPQKFTVVQKGTTTKVVVTHKKDTTTGDFSPVASKVQKTIVTVPTIKSIGDDSKPKAVTTQQQQQQSLIKPNQVVVRKHKISDINSEIKRLTTAEADDSGPPEVKKPVPSNRLVVISSNNAPKLLNNSLQQPGRVTTVNTSGAIQVQGTKLVSSSSSGNTSATTTKPLYTILKPSTVQQQQKQHHLSSQNKSFSVLKTNISETPRSITTTTIKTSTAGALPSTSSSSSYSVAQHKPLINKQSLLQQQQKIFQLKQLQKPKLTFTSYVSSSGSTTTNTPSLTTSSLSSTYLNIKIKEEPLDFLSENTKTSAAATTSTTTKASANYLAASSFAAPAPPQPSSQQSSVSDDLVSGVVRRKHCNCSKSQCLKLYCDCFANGEFCQDCTCKDCFNNLENEDERQKAIKSCLERNPSAFKPKITSSSDQGDMRLHNKGCNCKRSGCLKNYCECYEAKIPCSSNCKCVGCRNIEDRADLDLDPIDPKMMASLANASNATTQGQKRSYAQSGNVAIKTEKYSKDIKTEPGTSTTAPPPPLEKQQQCNFITQEVVDATIQCMITQADECEKNGLPAYQTEKMVMEELGRCLVEIIDFSIRNTDASFSQD